MNKQRTQKDIFNISMVLHNKGYIYKMNTGRNNANTIMGNNGY